MKPPRRKLRNTLRAAVVRVILVQRFPLAFLPKGSHKRPLKIGIFKDIRARCSDLASRDVHSALDDYTRGPSYLVGLQAGAARIDLDGNPCGVVDPSQADDAERRLRKYPEEIRQRWSTPQHEAAAAQVGREEGAG